MSDRHVIPDARGWHVERDHRQRLSATTAARADAVRRAVVFVSLEGGGRVVVHDADGSVQETRTITISGCEETADVVVPLPREPTTPERGSASGEGRPVASSPARRPVDVPRIGRADAAHRIDRLTEQAALPFDQLTEQILATATLVARLANPVRVVGRSVGAVVTAGVRCASLVGGRGPAPRRPRPVRRSGP